MNLTESSKEDAKRLGLVYLGFGRYGIDGRATHHVKDGVLVPFVRKSDNARKPTHPAIYEDENLVFIKRAFDKNVKKLKTRSRSACLLTQVANSISMQLGTDPQEYVDKFNPKGKGRYGHTLSTIIDGFSETSGLDIDTHVLGDIDTALESIKGGVPVIAMVNTYGSVMSSLTHGGKDPRSFKNLGVLDVKRYKDDEDKQKMNMFHALMIVGYDKKHGHVIFRDTDPSFGKAGYIKIPYAFLKNTPESITRYLQLSAKKR